VDVMVKNKLMERLVDMCALSGSVLSAPLAKVQTRFGPARLPITYRFWDLLGVTPLAFHYYEPITRCTEPPARAWQRDPLLGINFNVSGQLDLLTNLRYGKELRAIPVERTVHEPAFYYRNSMFGPGDAEAYYSMIRHCRPRRILEIGGGYSTLVARLAIARNGQNKDEVEHICVEPYEQPWLEKIGLTRVVRSRVEDMHLELFESLEPNDILFIDSSHVLRTGGDVWFEYLQVLPGLRPGVLIHAHDIFLPYPYPKSWLTVHRRYWTEQYLLQGILQGNSSLEVVMAMYFLSREYPRELARAFPVYGGESTCNPGSFWLRKR
jgi:predicted O-methyltransferase YrrM